MVRTLHPRMERWRHSTMRCRLHVRRAMRYDQSRERPVGACTSHARITSHVLKPACASVSVSQPCSTVLRAPSSHAPKRTRGWHRSSGGLVHRGSRRTAPRGHHAGHRKRSRLGGQQAGSRTCSNASAAVAAATMFPSSASDKNKATRRFTSGDVRTHCRPTPPTRA